MNTVSQGLKLLADAIEKLEQNGHPVTDITTNTDGLEPENDLTAEFSVEVPLPFAEGSEESGSSIFTAKAAEVRQDGSVHVSFEGEITDKDIWTSGHTDRLEQQSRIPEGRLPPHRDPDALQEAYEKCDTFVEMKRALGADVTPEAVRQQMVKHGIHEVPTEDSPEPPDEDVSEVPEGSHIDSNNGSKRTEVTSDSTASPEMPEESTQTDPSQPTEAIISDGGYPTDLTVEELKEIIKSSQTLYEATQQLGVDRGEAREMLNRLNLLDLVTGRLQTKDERTVTSEEIDRRIHSSNITGA